MRIIKKGNPAQNLLRFTCVKCKCEFECEDIEYWIDSMTLAMYPQMQKAVASCPNCHRICSTTTCDSSTINNIAGKINDYKNKELVRCRDCKFVCMCDTTAIVPKPVYVKCTLTDNFHEPDWFCADGKR